MAEDRIAKIRATTLGYEDHGILTASLDLDYGDSGQGAGNYALDRFDATTRERVPDEACGAFVAGVLRACGVRRWEDVAGRTVIASIDDGLVRGIRPLPTEPGSPFRFADIERVAG